MLPCCQTPIPPSSDNDLPPSIVPLSTDSRCNNLKFDPPSSNAYVQPTKKEFIRGLHLVPKKKAEQISLRRRNTECENIDLEDEIPSTPMTPGRTPKSLISHLSRDGKEHYRRRLSFNVNGRGDADNENSNKGGGESEEGDNGQERKMTVSRSLFNIDVTSPLGQFVIKHYKSDPSLNILLDVESHCLTKSPVKNPSAIRLRVRHPIYPITFRHYSVRFSHIHTHQYKFKKEEIREFMKRMNTGLNKNSRRLLRQVKRCKVVLKPVTKADMKLWIPSQNQLTIDLRPLSAAEIAFWTMPKPPPSLDSVSIFPNGLNFASPNVNSVLGLKTRQDCVGSLCQKPSLNLSNFVSEEACAELVQNRKVLYRSLLNDCNGNCSNAAPSPSESYHILRDMLQRRSTSGNQTKEKELRPSSTNHPANNCLSLLKTKSRSRSSSMSCSRSEWTDDSSNTVCHPSTIHLGEFSVQVRNAKEGEEILSLNDAPRLSECTLKTQQTVTNNLCLRVQSRGCIVNRSVPQQLRKSQNPVFLPSISHFKGESENGPVKKINQGIVNNSPSSNICKKLKEHPIPQKPFNKATVKRSNVSERMLLRRHSSNSLRHVHSRRRIHSDSNRMNNVQTSVQFRHKPQRQSRFQREKSRRDPPPSLFTHKLNIAGLVRRESTIPVVSNSKTPVSNSSLNGKPPVGISEKSVSVSRRQSASSSSAVSSNLPLHAHTLTSSYNNKFSQRIRNRDNHITLNRSHQKLSDCRKRIRSTTKSYQYLRRKNCKT